MCPIGCREGGRELRREAHVPRPRRQADAELLLPVRQRRPSPSRTSASTRPARSCSACPRARTTSRPPSPPATPTPRSAARLTAAIEPGYAVTADADLVVDARQATQPSLKVDRPEAAPAASELGFSMTTNWGGPAARPTSCATSRASWSRPSKTSWPKFSWYAQSVLAKPDGTGNFDGSPYQYHVRIAEKGRVPADVQRSVPDRALARVDSITHARVPGSVGQRDNGASGPLPLKLRGVLHPGCRVARFAVRVHEGRRVAQPRLPVLGHATDVQARPHRDRALEQRRLRPRRAERPALRPLRRPLGNLLRLDVPMFSSDGMSGSTPHTGRTTVDARRRQGASPTRPTPATPTSGTRPRRSTATRCTPRPSAKA